MKRPMVTLEEPQTSEALVGEFVDRTNINHASPACREEWHEESVLKKSTHTHICALVLGNTADVEDGAKNEEFWSACRTC